MIAILYITVINSCSCGSKWYIVGYLTTHIQFNAHN